METNHVGDAQEKVDNEKLAEERKENGNNSYRQKNYVEALKLYTEAIGNIGIYLFSIVTTYHFGCIT